MATAVTLCQMASDLCAQSGSSSPPFAVDIEDAERGGTAVSINKLVSSQSQYSGLFPVPLPPVKEDEIEIQNVQVMDIGRDSKEQRIEKEIIEVEELENRLLEGSIDLILNATATLITTPSGQGATRYEAHSLNLLDRVCAQRYKGEDRKPDITKQLSWERKRRDQWV